jgi:hypothetical protein
MGVGPGVPVVRFYNVSTASKRRRRLNDWCDRWVDIRDDLAFRKAKGEPLDPDELTKLQRLNRELEALMPKPQQLPPEARRLIRQALAFGKARGRAEAEAGEVEINLDDFDD